MEKEQIEIIVTNYLTSKSIIFSHQWKTELIIRLGRLKGKSPIQYVGGIHDSMLNEMIERGKYWLRSKFPKYTLQDVEDISHNGFVKWYNSFNAKRSIATKNPEQYWFYICISTAQIDWHNKTHPAIGLGIKMDENGIPILNKMGEEIQEKIRADFFEIVENAYDSQDDSDEEFTSSDLMLSENAEAIPGESNLEEEEIEINISSPSLKPAVVISPDEMPDSKISKEKRNGLMTLGGKRFSEKAMEEIIKFYLISGRTIKGKIRILPKIKTIYKPVKKSIPNQARKELDNLTDSSVNSLNRFEYLKYSEKRKWMEIAIGEMRKSKDKMELLITKNKKADSTFDEMKFRQNTPILSSVVLDSNQKLVATCFKGKIDTYREERNITFDKHCEYSLFTDVIKDENYHLVQNGTLYVTLEPCNKRGFWLDGDEKKPKIPCAVRCVEVGLKRVFIGSVDDNKAVYKKGKEILETGKYIFYLKDGEISGTKKEVEAEKLLEARFKNRNCQYEIFSDRIVYQIGEKVEVHDFESDLIEEVRRINSVFLQRHSPDKFRE